MQAKEGEFGSVAPLAAEKAKEAEALANKLNSIQGYDSSSLCADFAAKEKGGRGFEEG